MLAEEQARLHPVPVAAHTVAFGVTRTVAAKTPMVAFDGGQYSVPAHLLGQVVWVRVHGAVAQHQERGLGLVAGLGDSPQSPSRRRREVRVGQAWTTRYGPPMPGDLDRADRSDMDDDDLFARAGAMNPD